VDQVKKLPRHFLLCTTVHINLFSLIYKTTLISLIIYMNNLIIQILLYFYMVRSINLILCVFILYTFKLCL
jgi:hypothetical protein